MDPIKQFMHQINMDAVKINKNIVGKTDALREIPVDRSIYNENKPVTQPALKKLVTAPAPELIPQPEAPSQQTEISGLNKKEINEFLTRISSMEKKIDRFFNLIEKRVVKNAKEINIRIKLNELNENTNTEQE